MGMIRIQFPKDGDPEKIAELVRKIGREIEERNRKKEQEGQRQGKVE
jgi:hypothetical protein